MADATSHCLELLRLHVIDQHWLAENYCAAVHAARSVKTLCASNPVPGTVPGNNVAGADGL
jgi:hypothetical protein